MGLNLRHSLPRIACVSSRQKLILEYCRDKSVLHLGCVESGSVRESFQTGELLHLQLQGVATQLIGLDIDSDGIQFLTDQGIPNLVRVDLEAADLVNIAGGAEVVVAGELIEHLSNPGLVIQRISELLKKTGGTAIITVPNAFSIRHLFSVMFSRTECVMPDHNFYFSYVTLRSLLSRNGLEAIDWYAYADVDRVRGRVKMLAKLLINRSVFKWCPFLAEGIVVIARYQNG